MPEFSWLDFLFSFQGRASRSQYWLRYVLPFTLLFGIIAMIYYFVFGGYDPPNVLSFDDLLLIFTLVTAWPGLAVNIKRLHDRNRTGWFLLLGLIPLLNIWMLVELYFLRGTIGENRFGPDPAAI